MAAVENPPSTDACKKGGLLKNQNCGSDYSRLHRRGDGECGKGSEAAGETLLAKHTAQRITTASIDMQQ
jgi:hypothetical protein